jgi:diadenosine tetraphosphate (Ap4A) HIT family hydrolase
MVACVSCGQHERSGELPPRDRIHLGTYWRVAHAWSALPGWLVIISLRHVVDLAQLTDDEATELGRILRQTSAALGVVTGCVKTYTMAFGEQPGFEHLHIHVVPRMADFEKRHLGSGVFEFLKRPESEWVSAEARDRLAVGLAAILA